MAGRPPRPRVRWLRGDHSAMGYAKVVLLGCLIGSALSAATVLWGNGPLATLDAGLQDRVIRAQPLALRAAASGKLDPARDPRSFITIVAIDERTIAELGSYSGGYPRRYYAQLVDNLLVAAPRAIAFDLGFFEPTPDDALLAAAFDRARSQPLPTSIILGAAGAVPRGGSPDHKPGGEIYFTTGLSPVPVLAARADLAVANIVANDSGTIRSTPLLAFLDGVERPTMGLAAAARYLRQRAFYESRDQSGLQLAGRTIPLESNTSLRIGYLGPPSDPYSPDSTFRVVSMVDVLRGRLDPAIWRGGLVMVGALGATGLADDYWTPTSENGRKMAGVEIHANVAASLFAPRFLVDGSPLLVGALTCLLAVLVALLTARLGALTALLVVGLSLATYAGANVWALYAYGLLLPYTTPLLAGLLSFTATAAYGRAVEGRRLAHLRDEAVRAAQHDPLTGLPNRARLSNYLDDVVQESRSQAKPFGLLLLDLDRFKDINETLGHQVGDQVLQHVARRLREAAPTEAFVARLGGDEFAVLVPNASVRAAASAGERLADVSRVPMLIDGHEVAFDVSIGVVAYPHHGDNPGTLLRHAELAMYAAKQTRSGCSMYSADQDEEARARLALASALRGAVARDELTLDYQPKVDCRSGRVVGVEALLRWEHPELGRVEPNRFIPLAEQTGLIGHITHWVLAAALRQSRAWLNVGVDLSIALNISAVDAQDRSLPDTLRDLLEEWHVPAAQLTLELTEGALLSDPGRALEILNRIDALGVRVSLDDFGTGYSSLGYLKRFPVRELKIDRSFVDEAVHEPRDRAIVRSTVELGHNLGLVVVAEGVEDEATLELLRALGCDQVQGFQVGRPMPAAELEVWLRSGVNAAAA